MSDVDWVSREGARRYGVVLNDAGAVDSPATAALRATLAAARPARIVFDRGGSIEALKNACFEETGLMPPEVPRFRLRRQMGSEST